MPSGQWRHIPGRGGMSPLEDWTQQVPLYPGGGRWGDMGREAQDGPGAAGPRPGQSSGPSL